MAASALEEKFANFPPDLVLTVVCGAAIDADRVAQFLDRLNRAGPRKVYVWPHEFLLELSAALRLLAWEANGIYIHREVGLPLAAQALRSAFRWLTETNRPDPTERLALRVFLLSVERLAWAGPPILGAELVLGDVEEDQLVDVLANILWTHRRMK